VHIAGDGEESSVDEDEDDGEREKGPEMTPEMIVELAYTENPKVFERDAATRRSKERAALRAQTGMSDDAFPINGYMRTADSCTLFSRLGGRTDRRFQDHARSKRASQKSSIPCLTFMLFYLKSLSQKRKKKCLRDTSFRETRSSRDRRGLD
jgi:hypothetical protein